MFVTKNQFFVFIACIAIGGVGGIFFTVAKFIKFFIKNSRLKMLPDIAAFCVFTAWYVWISFNLQFPSQRIYMTAGVLVGLLLYFKSFNFILDLWLKKLYNIFIKKLTALKIKRKANGTKNAKRNERRKQNKKRGISARRKFGGKGLGREF